MTISAKIKVYGGLSVFQEDVEAIFPNASFSKPIKRGGTFRDVQDGYHVIVIIDGRFQQSMAVSPSELMDTLRCGVRVYGSSSMGALRAVELEPYGMIGYGEIFEHIKRTPYFRDDYLGQVFTEEGHNSLSEPYVNFMFSINKMRDAKEISPADHDVLDELYKQLHFGERDLYSLIEQIKQKHSEDQERLIGKAKQVFSYHNQKREDGLGLLKKVHADLKHIKKTNQELRERIGRIPAYEGLYPTKKEYEQQLAEFKETQKKTRASYFSDFLKQSSNLPAFKKPVESDSSNSKE